MISLQDSFGEPLRGIVVMISIFLWEKILAENSSLGSVQ